MKYTLLTLSALALAVGSSQAALVFTEDFGTLADGTDITTSNTDFTYVRAGTGSAIPDAIDPSNVGTGSSGFVQQVNATTSLTGVGVQSTLTGTNVYTYSVDFRFTNVTAGDIVFGLGTGGSFTGNSNFATAHGLFWLQSDNGNFERRTGAGAWVDVAGGTIFDNATNYNLHVVANASGADVNYGSEVLAAGTMDIYLDGVLIDDGVAVTNSISANGFRIYSVSGTGIEIDNVSIWDSAETAIPEPSSTALLGLGGLAFILRRRR